jgi:hypothetical protein
LNRLRGLRHCCSEHAWQAEIAETVSNAELAKVAEFFSEISTYSGARRLNRLRARPGAPPEGACEAEHAETIFNAELAEVAEVLFRNLRVLGALGV